MNEDCPCPDEKVGYVLFLPWAQGTRSASTQPFLVHEPDQALRLFHPGDNPFENGYFKSLHGSWCKLSGTVDSESGVFKVDQAEILPDPFGVSRAGEDGP